MQLSVLILTFTLDFTWNVGLILMVHSSKSFEVRGINGFIIETTWNLYLQIPSRCNNIDSTSGSWIDIDKCNI